MRTHRDLGAVSDALCLGGRRFAGQLVGVDPLHDARLGADAHPVILLRQRQIQVLTLQDKNQIFQVALADVSISLRVTDTLRMTGTLWPTSATARHNCVVPCCLPASILLCPSHSQCVCDSIPTY